MLKKTITYEDFNGDSATETLYFNLTRTETIDLMDLRPRLEEWSNRVSGDPRELTTDEVRELLNLVKLLIDASYGLRSPDGKRFVKNDDILTEFKQTALYDEFLFGLFENIEECLSFLQGIVPKKFATAAEDIQAPKVVEVALPQPVLEEVKPWIAENRDPTGAELQSMSKEEMIEAFARKLNG